MSADGAIPLGRLMAEVVGFSVEHVNEGGIPFAAFIVDKNGGILGRGVNRVREHCDPTAHAEVEAIRDACRTLGTARLPGMTLLASGEPCPMCYMSALHAGISQIFFAVDREEAAVYGFDYRGTYDMFGRDPLTWRVPVVRRLAVPEGQRPFRKFRTAPRTS